MTKRIAIAGFGREGQAVLGFLKRMPEYKHAEIWILDKNPNLKLPRGVYSQLGKNYLVDLKKFDTIFRSPGIPYECSEFRRARAKGVKFSSATKLFFEFSSKRTCNIIGITGTKGKGTTSTLLYNILRAAKKTVMLAGNIGIPMLDLLSKLKKGAIVILELSSFQLQDVDESPHIAVVLDIFPDHQNAHRNLREYYGAKSNIARFQKKDGVVFFFPNNTVSRKIASMSRGKRIPIHSKNNMLFSPEDLKIKGEHNYMNALMAASVAKTLRVPRETIRKAVRNFRGLPHRLEFVRKISLKNRSVSIWNDSASSNPGSAAAAVRAFHNEDTVLIAGGKDKHLDYRPLAQALKHSPARAIVLYGENKEKIARALAQATRSMGHGKPKIVLVDNLKSAIHYAYQFALSHVSLPMIHIVLSPGSASFDQFKNFDERGDMFKKIVRSIK